MDELLELAHAIHPFTICGEGNVSGRDGNTFWIKASGTSLDTLTKDGLVACRMNGVPFDGLGSKPSMEVSFHAWILDNYSEVNYVAHTHPTYTNQILCSRSSCLLLLSRTKLCSKLPSFFKVSVSSPGLMCFPIL